MVERFALRDGQATVTKAGNLVVGRTGHVATVLPNGEILFAGGTGASAPFAEKFDPGTGISVPAAASGHALPAVAVARGKILLYGWTIAPHFGAELYDIESNSFITLADPPSPIVGQNYLTLSTGEVLISARYTSFAVYLFNFPTGTFRSSYPLSISREDHAAVELADGRVLLAGGYDLNGIMSGDERSPELYALRLDHDQDGMEDSWELANGLDPGNRADAIEDADGDGHTNLQEYLAGTDPHDPTSILRFESIQAGTNTLRLRFSFVLGKSYRVQQTTNLLGGDWADLSGDLAGTGRPIEVPVPVLAGTVSQTFRVILLP